MRSTARSTSARRQEPGRRRADVLSALKAAAGPLSAAELAELLGLHKNTVRFHLDALVADGQVTSAQGTDKRPGRPSLMFSAVRGMDPGGPRHYLLLAEVLTATLVGQPDVSTRAVEAGRTWGEGVGQQLAGEAPTASDAVGDLVTLLDDLDFAPELSADGREIGLRRCPFLEVAATNRSVVCPVHLGLMQGALDTWGAPLTVDRLDPFVEPDLCVAHLAAARAVSPSR
jgi:predicted ArsR family transcriptional regulator